MPSNKYTFYLWILLVCPVLQSELEKSVINPLGRERIHLYHVLEERSQLPWVIGKDGDELFWIGLGFVSVKTERNEILSSLCSSVYLIRMTLITLE